MSRASRLTLPWKIVMALLGVQASCLILFLSAPAWGWVVSAGVSGGAVIWIAVRFSGRISEIARAARRYSEGELSYRVSTSGSPELADLGESLNRMAEQLAEHIAEVEERQREQQAMLQSMASGVLALDPDQRIMSMNRSAERLFGVQEAECRGRLMQEVIRQPELHRLVQRALADSEAATSEFAIHGKKQPIVQAVCRALRDAEGRARGLLIVLNDVTESRRFESLRSDFAANVSHELRTPITNIKGYIDTLMEVGWEDAEQARRFLDIIARNSDRLAAIVEDVMALTKLESPRARESLEFTPTPIARIVDNVVSQFELAAGAKRITLRSTVHPDITAPVHAPLIEQAIANLVSNAIKYSPPETTVTISAAERTGDRHEVEIAVADQGPGVPSDQLPRLFERFYRVDKARSRELGGTGLGLAIVKHIALVHRGRAEVESAVGKGSLFRLVVPGE